MINANQSIEYDLESFVVTILKKMTIYQIYKQMKEDFMNETLMAYHFPMEVIDFDGNYEMKNSWMLIDSRKII